MRSATLVKHDCPPDNAKKDPVAGHDIRRMEEMEERDTRLVSWIVSGKMESSRESGGTKALKQLSRHRNRYRQVAALVTIRVCDLQYSPRVILVVSDAAIALSP